MDKYSKLHIDYKGKNMDKYSKLHIDYTDAVAILLDNHPHNNIRLAKQVDAFFRSCALILWKKSDMGVEEQTKAVNQIYQGENKPHTISAEIIKNYMEKVKAMTISSITAPRFFRDIIEYNRQAKLSFRKFLVNCFNDILELLAKFAENSTLESLFYTSDLIAGSYRKLMNMIEDNKPKTQEAASAESETKTDFDELDALIGLDSVKKRIKEIENLVKVQSMREKQGLTTAPMSYHLVFTGNPGTGKTTVARIVAKIYKELGLLSKGHLVEADSSDLIAGYIGQTAIKTQELLESAKGGVLFIDEAYTLADNNEQGYGKEAIDTLLKFMEDNRDDFAVIAAGYDNPMEKFINSNPGLKSRFNKYIHFDDYNPDELYRIFKFLCNENQYRVAYNAEIEIKEYLKYVFDRRDENFANGRTVRNYFENVITNQANRVSAMKNAVASDLVNITIDDVKWEREEKEVSLDDSMEELNSLIGLTEVKEEINSLIKLVQVQNIRKKRGMSVAPMSYHLVFTGNPGTGKTTVARLAAQIYKSLGLLSKGHIVETDRSGLVAGYVGQTALKTQEVINKALGGVLFIDEAYTLTSGDRNDFGQEAVDTLLKAMEDNRDNLIVIAAGYEELMDDFIESNPGLKSRFNRYIHFEDYTSDELAEIFESLCEKNQYKLAAAAKSKLKTMFNNVDKSTFGNGRGVRNIFEKTLTVQAGRISENVGGDMSLITDKDLEGVEI